MGKGVKTVNNRKEEGIAQFPSFRQSCCVVQQAYCTRVTKSICNFYPQLILGPTDGNVIEYWHKIV